MTILSSGLSGGAHALTVVAIDASSSSAGSSISIDTTIATSGGLSSSSGDQSGNSATDGSFHGDYDGHDMRVASSDDAKPRTAALGSNDLRSIWDDESILHSISKDLNPASVLAADTERALLGGFDQTDDATDDFFDLLGEIDSQRQSESSAMAGLTKDPLATLKDEDTLARQRVRKS